MAWKDGGGGIVIVAVVVDDDIAVSPGQRKGYPGEQDKFSPKVQHAMAPRPSRQEFPRVGPPAGGRRLWGFGRWQPWGVAGLMLLCSVVAWTRRKLGGSGGRGGFTS